MEILVAIYATGYFSFAIAQYIEWGRVYLKDYAALLIWPILLPVGVTRLYLKRKERRNN